MHTIRAVRRASTTLITVVTVLAFGVGVDSAASADSLGVDVSSWQHTRGVNWSRVKADHTTFAFIKATEGTGYVNPYFRRDWASTLRVGLYRGAYHFARPRHGNARAQARFFVRVAGSMHHRGDLPPVLDLETTGGLRPSALQRWTRTWLRTVRHATGRRPIVYTSPVFWRAALGNSRKFAGYPLWIAHYGVPRPQVPGGWGTWTFWQGRRNGRVAGIGGGVDRNAFHGSMRRLRRLAHAGPLHASRRRTRRSLPKESTDLRSMGTVSRLSAAPPPVG
jgi:GH25 family lysozyme M1 (1,4-beta-N-acetylmuramidase)